MKTTLHGVVHGKTTELEEDPGLQDGPQVEVVLTAAAEVSRASRRDVFDLIASLAPGNRSKADIDRQIREGRDA